MKGMRNPTRHRREYIADGSYMLLDAPAAGTRKGVPF